MNPERITNLSIERSMNQEFQVKKTDSPYKVHSLRFTSKSGGFTLIEVLVSAAILVILASGFVGLQYILSQNQVSAWRNFQTIENANQAISAISKELRNAQASEIGSYPLDTTN